MSTIDSYTLPHNKTLKSFCSPNSLNNNNNNVIDRESDLKKSRHRYSTLNPNRNESNNHIARKSSLKQKLLSMFKTHSKLSQQNSPTESFIIDENNNPRVPGTEYNPQDRCQSASLRDNHSTVHRNSQKLNKSNEIHDSYFKRLDSGDLTLIDQFQVHPINAQILKYITESNCSSIKLPSNWCNTIGSNSLTNSFVMPFISTIPGLMGIENHGSTCYVNVIIQCLSHIDPVAEYFATKDYLKHAKYHRHTSQNSQIVTGFDVMVAFSYFLQSLWQTTYQNKISMKFCQLLTMHKSEFSLDSQQDAHELLLFILNLLHDNLVQKSPTSKINNDQESRERHTTNESTGNRNNGFESETSFIYQRFRGLLSNEIVCPECRYSRKTFDQILSLNLQIPKQSIKATGAGAVNGTGAMESVMMCMVVNNQNQVSERHGFEIGAGTSVGDVRLIVAGRLGCSRGDIVIIELGDGGFGTPLSDDEKMMSIYKKNHNFLSSMFDHISSGLYAICIPNQVVDVDALQIDTAIDNDATVVQKRVKEFPDNQPFIRILIVHVEKTKDCVNEISDELRRIIRNDDHDITRPFHESDLFFNENNYSRFTNILTVQAARKTKLSLLRHSLSEQMFRYFNLRKIKKLPKPQFIIGGSHLVSELDIFPLTHPSVNKDLKYTMNIYGEESAHIRMLVVWPFGTTDKLRMHNRGLSDSIYETRFFSLNPHKIFDHSSVRELSLNFTKESSDCELNRKKSANIINVTDCLRDFFSLDTLSITESWKCPNCQTSQPARTEIHIEEAPETLILMLKRFSKKQTKAFDDLSDNKYQNQTDQTRRHLSRNTTISEGYKVKNGFITKPNTSRSKESLNKLEGLVNYPLKDLDLRPYMVNAENNGNYLYDLVGVVNHQGSLFTGHYVAICLNSIDNKWRLYDDHRVREISASEVVQPDAYILFYKRQESQSNSNSNLHWSYRRLTFPEKLHRNHSPSPTSLYSRPSKYSEKGTVKSLDSYSTLPLSIMNNHSSTHSLISNCSSELRKEEILSSHLESSNISPRSSQVECNFEPQEMNGVFNMSRIKSEIIDVDSVSIDSSIVLDINHSNSVSPNDSCTKLLNEDSGTVLSQDFSCPMQSKNCNSSIDNNSKDECYNSFSISSSTSSPITSNTY